MNLDRTQTACKRQVAPQLQPSARRQQPDLASPQQLEPPMLNLAAANTAYTARGVAVIGNPGGVAHDRRAFGGTVRVLCVWGEVAGCAFGG